MKATSSGMARICCSPILNWPSSSFCCNLNFFVHCRPVRTFLAKTHLYITHFANAGFFPGSAPLHVPLIFPAPRGWGTYSATVVSFGDELSFSGESLVVGQHFKSIFSVTVVRFVLMIWHVQKYSRAPCPSLVHCDPWLLRGHKSLSPCSEMFPILFVFPAAPALPLPLPLCRPRPLLSFI